MLVLSIGLGFVFSLLASFIIWYILNKMLVPQIALSETIHCVPALVKKDTKLYKVTVTNLSNRDAFDVNLQGRFVLYGVNSDQPDEPYFYVASVGTGSHPYLPKKAKQGEDRKENHRKFRVRPSKAGKPQIAKLCNLEEDNVNVSTILQANPRNYLEIVVTCTHSASSARKITRRVYHFENIEQPTACDSKEANRHETDADTDSDDPE